YLQTPDTLIAFDIDNTLARTEHELGSDQWFCYLVDQKIAQGYDYLSAISAVLPLCYYAQFNVPLIPTESNIPLLLNKLHELNIFTMGLTSRSLPLAERTHEQLLNININFYMPAIKTEELILPLLHQCIYKYEIIFTSDNDKGEALLKFLDMINYRPQCIIFVDDKMRHIQSVEKAAISRNIEYIGIRYSGCDELINNFDPIKAYMQLQALLERNRSSIEHQTACTSYNKSPLWYYPFFIAMKLFTCF